MVSIHTAVLDFIVMNHDGEHLASKGVEKDPQGISMQKFEMIQAKMEERSFQALRVPIV